MLSHDYGRGAPDAGHKVIASTTAEDMAAVLRNMKK
jgi:hypothetical protein